MDSPWYQSSFSVDYCHTKAQPRLGHALSACTAKEEVSTWYQHVFKHQVIAVSSPGNNSPVLFLQFSQVRQSNHSSAVHCRMLSKMDYPETAKGAGLVRETTPLWFWQLCTAGKRKKYQKYWEKAAGGCCTIICCIYQQIHINTIS